MDDNVWNDVENRKYKYCIYENEYDIPKFNQCQYDYFNFFMNKTNLEIQKYIIFLPMGSIIFHGASCHTYSSEQGETDPKRFVPPLYPVIIEDTNYTAIDKILNEETLVKKIGTINHDDTLTEHDRFIEKA